MHAAAKARGMDDDTRRALIARLTGETSCRDCTESQLRQVLDALNGRAGGGRRRAESPLAGKARALWQALYHLGEVEDRSEAALAAWVKRQTIGASVHGEGVDALQWLSPEQWDTVIEGLKAWCERAGFRQKGISSIMKARNAERARQELLPWGQAETLKFLLVKAVAARLGAAVTGLDAMSKAELDARTEDLSARLRRRRADEAVEAVHD